MLRDIGSKLLDLYCFNMRKYSFMFKKKDGEVVYHTTNKPFSIMQIYHHLDGKMTMSVYAGDMDTVFSTFDVDEPDPDLVRRVMDKLAELGVPRERMYVSTSGNKGYHIDIFYDQPIFKASGERLYKYLMKEPRLAERKVEYFPTGGRCIKIPLGVNFKSGRRCWYLDRETLESIEDIEYVLGIEKWAKIEFEEMMYRLNKAAKTELIQRAIENAKESAQPKPKPPSREQFSRQDWVDKEPDIEHPGERHNNMLKKAKFLRIHGASEEILYEELLAYVARQQEKHPDGIASSQEEIEEDARLIAQTTVKAFEPKYNWVGNEVVRKKETNSNGVITAQDLANILLCTKPSTRKVAFVICVYTSCFGQCTMGYNGLSERSGVSVPTVNTALKELREKKIIGWWKRGGFKEINGEPRPEASSYKFTQKQLFGVWPEIMHKQKIFQFDKVRDDLMAFYYRTMATMLSPYELKNQMTAGELEKCKPYLAEAVIPERFMEIVKDG